MFLVADQVKLVDFGIKHFVGNFIVFQLDL